MLPPARAGPSALAPLVDTRGVGGGGQRVDKGSQGAPQQRKQGYVVLLVPLGMGRERGAGAFVILGSPVCGLGYAGQS